MQVNKLLDKFNIDNDKLRIKNNENEKFLLINTKNLHST